MKDHLFYRGNISAALILGGLFAAISFGFYYLQPQKMEFFIFFLILTLLTVISLLHFAKADSNKITFFTYAFLPHTFYFRDIIALSLQHHSANGNIFLITRNGKRNLIKLRMFSKPDQEKIISLISEKIEKDSSFFRDPEYLTLWLKESRKEFLIRNSIPALILIAAGFATKSICWSWDWKQNHWEEITAVIETNQHQTIKNDTGKKEKIYRFSYRYSYKGKQYSGNKIFGGATEYNQSCGPGTTAECIVNPRNPSESALIYQRYRADWIYNFLGTFFLFLGICLQISVFFSLRKKIAIPENLKKYITKFELQKIQELIFSVRGNCKISIEKIKHGIICIENRYFVFPPQISKIYILLWGILMILSVIGGVLVLPHFLLTAILCAVLLWRECFPRCAVYDKEKKAVYWSRLSSEKNIPEKLKTNEYLPVSDIIAFGLTFRHDTTILLSGIRRDGVTIPIAVTSQKNAAQLLSDTVFLAEKFGNIPVITL